MTTPGRRALRFATLDEINADVDRLMAGHRTVGHWSLARICAHLAGVIRLTLDLPASTTHDPSLRFGPERVAEVFATESLPEGLALPSAVAQPEPPGDREAADRLRSALAAFADSPGPVAPHRFLGPLTRDQWEHLHRIHCAHHLSFVVPDEFAS